MNITDHTDTVTFSHEQAGYFLVGALYLVGMATALGGLGFFVHYTFSESLLTTLVYLTRTRQYFWDHSFGLYILLDRSPPFSLCLALVQSWLPG